MLRARLTVGLCAAAATTVGAALVADGAAPQDQPGVSCTETESSYTTDSLHDIRSFSDALAIVRGVRQTIPPPPGGPEGYAGFIGRTVSVRVERILWRRPHAPEPPRRFRFGDWGWWGTLENRRAIRPCRETRMVLGRRYLAPIVRHNGTWYPFFPTRLRLRGDLVVGGVDGEEPENSHQALAGRSVRGAARLVAETLPYRAVALNPNGSPARRWQRVDRDGYRVWKGRGLPEIVASGVTARSRWQVYIRRRVRGGLCVGVSARRLWRGHSLPSGEGCGLPGARPRSVGSVLVTASRRGVFAVGLLGSEIARVRVRFDGEEWKEARTVAVPLRGTRYLSLWVAAAEGDCPALTAQGLDRAGEVVAEQRSAPRPEPPAGSPDPYAACRSG
jgi:hypothetical protein